MEYDDLIGKRNWLVIHEAELYDKNPNLIGFRDPSEWRSMKQNDMVFYYRASPYMQIMGIYKIIRTEEGIDKNFHMTNKEGRREYLRYQHELELVNSFQRYFGKNEHERLSFYHTFKNPNRWDNQHVFRMSFGDLKLIMK